MDETDDSTEPTNVVDRFDAAREALSDGDLSTMLQALSLSSLGDEIEGPRRDDPGADQRRLHLTVGG